MLDSLTSIVQALSTGEANILRPYNLTSEPVYELVHDGIARALAVSPEILLMDEPFGALDLQTRDLMQDELLRIWQTDRKTVLFVTHSIEEAIYLSDRIIVLSPRPATVQRDIPVPFVRPRNEDLKTSPAFLEIRREIWSLLKHGAAIA